MRIFLISFLTLAFIATGQAQYRADPVISGDKLQWLEEAMPAKAAATPKKKRRVLVFSRTCEFRHYEGIASTKIVVEMIGNRTGAWETVISDDLANFEPEALARFDCVIMNNTTGMIFSEHDSVLKEMSPEEVAKIKARDARLRDNLINYVRKGGGLFGNHASTDAYRRPAHRYEPYLEMIGGDLIGHPWISYDETVCVIEDRDSPIMRGLRPEFRIKHEQYMFGKVYDRKKLRVLMSLDIDRSPKKNGVREDGDCALVWIKDFGKGRVAYSAFGHHIGAYYLPDLQTMTMRLIQFACGDLEADTTPLPKPAVPAPGKTKKFFPKPTPDQISALRDSNYGTDTDAIDWMVFSVFNYNDDESFCLEMEEFLLTELSSGKGTPRYRAMLAELMDAIGVHKQGERLRQFYNAEKDESVRSRLISILTLWEKGPQSPAKEPAMNIPASLPSDRKELASLIGYFMKSPAVKMPAYLTLDALDDEMKPRLMYALAKRNVSVAELSTLQINTADMLLAAGYWVSRRGNAGNFGLLFSKSDLLDKEQTKRMAVYLSNTEGRNIMRTLIPYLAGDSTSSRDLAIEALSLMEVDKAMNLLTKDFDSASRQTKLAVLSVLESSPTMNAFAFVIGKLPGETDTLVRGAMQRTLTRMAQGDFSDEMYAMVLQARKAGSEKDRLFYLRFAALRSNKEALEFCREALKDKSTMSEALKVLGNWKNADASPVLMEFAQNASAEREKILAQMALLSLAEKVSLDKATMDYLVNDAVRPEERDAAKALRDKKKK